MSRLAVLTDIHGNLPALEAVIADAQGRGCEAFVNLGDILSGPLWPVETADLLMALDWPTLAGNHERQLLTEDRAAMGESDAYTFDRLSDRHMAWMESLPQTMDYTADIFLCHGTPDSDLVYFLEDVGPDGACAAAVNLIVERAGKRGARLTLCGHTHKPRMVVLPDGRTVANPGSVGLPAYAASTPYPHVMEGGTPDARYAIVTEGEVELIEVPYDFERAAVKAQAAGRGDWAQALRHGHMGR